jgi:hypothetical protein
MVSVDFFAFQNRLRHQKGIGRKNELAPSDCRQTKFSGGSQNRR